MIRYNRVLSDNTCAKVDTRPWQHLIIDNFLSEDVFSEGIRQVGERRYSFEIDYRGQGRIEYSLLESEVLWRSIYSVQTIQILTKAFNCGVRLNKQNLLQLRRMNDETPEFPVHNDHIQGRNTIAAFFYLSGSWSLANGGRLFLHDGKDTSIIAKSIDPLPNRFVAFKTDKENWHSVEKVKNWERLFLLSVWDIF